ncbi:MAG: transcription factor S [archaeon]
MEFCPKCGAVLVQKKGKNCCPRCNYSIKGQAKIKTSEKIDERKEIYVISEKDSEIHPIVTEICKKCGNNKVYFWTVQTRSSDEAETKFFKCTKCDYTWRDYR